MILTVSLSPCVDVNIEVDSLSVGMSHKIISKRTFYTGKGINVSIGLARLGVQTFVTGFMYEDNGRLFEQELHREGLNYKFVWNKGRVRENYKFVDHKSMLTEFDDVSPEISQQKQDDLIKFITEFAPGCEAVFVAGGLAKGMTADFYGRILSAVPNGVKKIVDSEGERLRISLACGVDLIKPNIDEMQRTLGIRVKSRATALEGAKQLISMGAKNVLLSLGKDGAIITDGIKDYYCKSNNVAMNSTVGAGDAMIAAAMSAMMRGADNPEVLKCGVAAGTAAVITPDAISFKKEKYDEIYSTLSVKEI